MHKFRRTFGVRGAKTVHSAKDVLSDERQVKATVLALVPKYHLVKVQARNGH